MALTREQLLALNDLAGSTLEEAAKRNPELFRELAGAAVAEKRAAVHVAFDESSAEARRAVAGIDFSKDADPALPAGAQVAELMRKTDLKPEVRGEIARRLGDMAVVDTRTGSVGSDVAIDAHPLFGPAVAQARVAALATVANVPAPMVDALLKHADSLESLDDERIGSMVRSGAIGKGEAERLGVAASVFHLSEGEFKLAGAIAGTRVARPEDLVKLDAADWAKALKSSGTAPPEGFDVKSYAEELDRRAMQLFPNETLLNRVMPREASAYKGSIEQTEALFKLNPAVAASDFDALDLGDADKDEVARLRIAHGELQTLARLHPGLRLTAVIDGEGNSAVKAREIGRRLDAFKKFEDQNAELELLDLDLTRDSEDLDALDFSGIDEVDGKRIVADLKAYQRASAITDDISEVGPLIAAGYHSSARVAADDFDVFVAKTGLTAEKAERIYSRTTEVAGTIVAQMGAVFDLVRGGFDKLKVGNIGPNPLDHLRELDGFDDMFGSQDFCDCDHCQSIMSPAAYFVDLMKFVEEHVTKTYFSGTKANDLLALKSRRPDLWVLPLTCENTNTLLPTLDIINEVLENYIAKRRGFAGDFADRIAVGTKVYRDTLPGLSDSFIQPFVLPLARILAYLSHFSKDLGDVARATGAPTALRTRATLGLSKQQRDLILTANVGVAALEQLYANDFTVTAGKVAPVETKLLLRRMTIDRDAIEMLSEARFVTARGTEKFRFVQAKRSADSVQNDIERVHDLTPAILDRMHRFIRLSRFLPWSLAELDLLLDQALLAGLAPGFDAAALAVLADVKELAEQLKLKPEEAAALLGNIPNRSIEEGKPGLLDRLFNAKPFTLADGPLPNAGEDFIHPAFRDAAPPAGASATLPRLMAGLRLDAEQLAALISELAVPLGADLSPGSAEADRGFALSAANLALLYRHARLMRALKLSAPQLFQLIAFAGLGNSIGSLAEIKMLLDVYAFRRASGFSLDEIGFVIGSRVEDPSALPDPAALATTIAGEIATEKLTQFADTVLAFLPGVTEDQSRALIAANAAAVVAVPDSNLLRLADGFDPAAALTVPAGIALNPADAREALLAFHASRVLPVKLASHLGLPAEKLPGLAAMTGTNFAAAGIVAAINGGATAPLTAVVTKLAPLALLFRDAAFDVDALAFVNAQKAVFGVADFSAVSFSSLRSLLLFRDLTKASPLEEFTEDVQPVDPGAIRDALTGFVPATKFAAVPVARLAAALRVEKSLLTTLLPQITLPNTAPQALAALARAAALAAELGLDGRTLNQLLAETYDDLHAGAEGLIATFRTKYPDEADFDERITPSEDRIRGLKRDAIVDYLTRGLNPEFETRDALYQHFLVDVQLGGCARTSRVVAAISAVQLYCHRILINLEQDQRPDGDPLRTHVLPSAIPQDEWVWRKNYRVWEANRKVFLYPENYIEPDLRDDKSPLFRDLEQTLLQQDINEQTVLDAYTRYLAGFEEIARLKISGVYHDRNATERTDILHMFGVTSSDPPVHYYRAVENAYYSETEPDRGIVWSPWRKVEVQIPVRIVSPVVYLGRLFLFWNEITTQQKTKVSDGGSSFAGYKHSVSLRYTSLRLDGTWSPAQKLGLDGAQAPYANSWVKMYNGVINDPLYDSGESLLDWWTPRYDTVMHGSEPREDYTLRGYVWDRVYPEIRPNGELLLTAFGFGTRCKIDFVENAIVLAGYWNMQPPNVTSVLSIRPGHSPEDDVTTVPALHFGLPDQFLIDPFAQTTITRKVQNQGYLLNRITSQWMIDEMFKNLDQVKIATLKHGDDLTIVNGRVSDAILTSGKDIIYLQAHQRTRVKGRRRVSSRGYIAKRLNTGLADELSRALFMIGVDGLLDIETQKTLKELGLPFTPTSSALTNDLVEDQMDFTGSLGVYFREIFFHVPALIANHLNAQGNYRAAQRWYHFIFDPTASETIVPPAGLSAAEKAWRQRDRVWRYIEFRNQDAPKLRKMLTDPVALETYKKDPFNPHAIARLRLSAYQKTIVMKYIDNLLDWGDNLFTQFTTESINEATMLYVMASDLLGPRPERLGSCGEGGIRPKNYETIGPQIGNNEEILAEFEQWLLTPRPRRPGKRKPPARKRPDYVADWRKFAAERTDKVSKKFQEPLVGLVADERRKSDWGFDDRGGGDPVLGIGHRPGVLGTAAPASGGTMPSLTHSPFRREGDGEPLAAAGQEGRVVRKVTPREEQSSSPVRTMDAKAVSNASPAFAEGPQLAKDGIARPMEWARSDTGMWAAARGDPQRVTDFGRPGKRRIGRLWKFGWALVRQVGPVFCIPENKDLLAYWTRVEDRLFKIRNCMDINGVRRLPALFAPEIDPRMLVRARAAGLSLEDVLNAAAGNLPPYRFAYLIEKAKQYAATVQGYGSSLYAALERRDNEELSRLRLVHQQNLLRIGTKLRELDIKTSNEAIEQISRQQAAIQYRLSYHQALLENDLSAWERTQQVAKHTATVASGLAALQQMLGAVFYLIPQLGSPFAMKYGGIELGNSAQAFATLARNVATLGDQISASAGLEAGFDRRREGWEHQIALAKHELKQLEKQQTAAVLRKEIAERSLVLHEENIKQADELFEFNNERFTNLGLYTYLATTMQRLYREAYNGAMAMSRLAEQAYRYERDDETTPLLEPSYWDATRAGLLSGEQLMMDLLGMEQRFIETNVRGMEVDQAFSLAQLDPAALLRLKESGTCEFSIPELAFDLNYPGQYRRRIKAVRLTIPCVTGPFTNIGATLTMTGSKLRRRPTLGDAELLDVPLRRSTTIATSTAQNDAGVLEFSFRDERYMPFEGAGAISAWRLSLPANFRPFDYETVTDAIVHIAYTADFDGLLRESVEEVNDATEGTIANLLANTPLVRTFSLRQDFSNAFSRLVHSPADSEVQVEITPRHFPLFLQGRDLAVEKATLIVRTPDDQTAAGVKFKVNGVEKGQLKREADLGDQFAVELGAGLAGNPIRTVRLAVANAGDLAPDTPPAGDASALDSEKVRDILLHLEFKVSF